MQSVIRSSYVYAMENSTNGKDPKEVLLDFSEEEQVSYWADKLGTTREIIKSAARACHSNTIGQIVDHLKESSKLNKDFELR